MKPWIVTFLTLPAALTWVAQADPAQTRQTLLADYTRQASLADSAFGGFSAKRGEEFFRARHPGGKPDTPACTTCHNDPPTTAGKTRANKPIDPMAVSKAPDRFTDREKVEKWFGRNCDSVLGRPCTALEKGDVVTYLSTL